MLPFQIWHEKNVTIASTFSQIMKHALAFHQCTLVSQRTLRYLFVHYSALRLLSFSISFSCCIFFICTLFMLLYFYDAFVLFCNLFNDRLFPCCTFFRVLHAAFSSCWKIFILYFGLFSRIFFQVTHFHVATCCTVFMLLFFRVALFSCCTFIILKNIENEQKKKYEQKNEREEIFYLL